MRLPYCLLSVLFTLALVPAAAAHVAVNPREAEAESFARFDVRVPTERPDASTTEVSVQLPEGLFFVSFQPKRGWKRTVEMEELSEPVELFGQPITERVASVTWSGGEIAPGEFDEFGFTARMPEDAGTELVFPSVQTYSSGEVVRWIGPADSDEPAPIVTLTAAEEEGGPAVAEETSASAQEADSGVVAGKNDDGGGRATVALVLAIVALISGLAALGVAVVRPRRA